MDKPEPVTQKRFGDIIRMRQQRGLAVRQRAMDTLSRAYWEHQTPSFPLPPPLEPLHALPPLPSAVALAAELRHEGYFRHEDVLEPWAVQRMLACVTAARELGFPATFGAFMEPFWQALRSPRLRSMVASVLGPRFTQMMHVWVHCVDARAGVAGWGPHIDYSEPIRFMPNGGPDRLTVWLPLTDATLDNGCMYAVPAHIAGDLAFKLVRKEDIPLMQARDLLHAAHALPARAGAALGWHFNVIHWGSHTTRHVSGPTRVAVSLEFLNEDTVPRAEEPSVLDPHTIPTFSDRAAVIGQSLCSFGRKDPAARPYLPLADSLCALSGRETV